MAALHGFLGVLPSYDGIKALLDLIPIVDKLREPSTAFLEARVLLPAQLLKRFEIDHLLSETNYYGGFP